MSIAKTIADRYIGRDGSDVGSKTRRRELTRAAVFAAQAEVTRILKSDTPLTDKQMHAVLMAAVNASPELFEPNR